MANTDSDIKTGTSKPTVPESAPKTGGILDETKFSENLKQKEIDLTLTSKEKKQIQQASLAELRQCVKIT